MKGNVQKAIVWGQIQVSSLNTDITQVEFEQIIHLIRDALLGKLGPDSVIRKRIDQKMRHNHDNTSPS